MDISTLVASVVSSLGLSVATLRGLSDRLITHRLDKELAIFRSDLERQRDHDKTELEGRIKERVETTLGDRSAEREYSLEARKRLYTAIGPLRFQLLIACRDLSGRVQAYGLGARYDMNLAGYYGRSFLFRILRPLCLAELVERQIAYADFGVDHGAVDLLRFKKNALVAFSGSSLVEGHPAVDWNHQRQHVFFDYLGRCANMMILTEPSGTGRAMRFHELDEKLKTSAALDALEPFPSILSDLTPTTKSLFWLRLVAYGYLCNDFVNRTGHDIGFERREYPVGRLLAESKDAVITNQMGEYERRCDALLKSPL